MTPDDPRHGENRGYIAGCQDQCCRAAHAAYRRNLRTRTYLARGRMLVDPTGTRRRIYALVALGHTMEGIDRELGQCRGYTYRLTQNKEIFRSSADKISKVYDRLSMVVPPGPIATRNRRYAASQGWLPPLAWDDDRIDDPTYRPALVSIRPTKDDIDPMVVERILSGDYTVPATKGEKHAVVAEFINRGIPLATLERAGWKPERYVDRQDGAA